MQEEISQFEQPQKNNFMLVGAGIVIVVLLGIVGYLILSPKLATLPADGSNKTNSQTPAKESGFENLTAEQKAVKRALAGAIKKQVVLQLETHYDQYKIFPPKVTDFSSESTDNLKLIQYSVVDGGKAAEVCTIKTLEENSCSRITIGADGYLIIRY